MKYIYQVFSLHLVKNKIILINFPLLVYKKMIHKEKTFN